MSIKHLLFFIALISFSTITAQKMNSKTQNHFIKITNQISVEDFERVKSFILKEGNRQTYRNYDNDNPYYDFKEFEAYLASDIGQKNINNDPRLSGFNTMTLKRDNRYYEIIEVRIGDIKAAKTGIIKGMKENEVYLTAYNQGDLNEIPTELTDYLEDIKKVN
jgi:hypothetical protein